MSNHLIPFGTPIDLSKREKRRTYVFPFGDTVVIEEPRMLVISENGHRIFDATGISHYIPMGWIHLFWENIPGRVVPFWCLEDQK